MAASIPSSPSKNCAKPAEVQYGPVEPVSAHLTVNDAKHDVSASPLPSPALATVQNDSTSKHKSDVKSYTDNQLAARFKVGSVNALRIWPDALVQFIEEVGSPRTP
jgi:hypothetical protein